VPSQTELLYDLGLEERVVGITRYCVRPGHWLQSNTVVGGTKNPSIERIRTLKPDLIIANREENRREDIEALEKFCKVWVSDIATITEALQMIENVGVMTGMEKKASALIHEIDTSFKQLVSLPPIPTAYLIWHRPTMVAAGETFIEDILKKGGFENVFSHLKRYPEIDDAALSQGGAKVVMLSSEPFSFKEKHSTYYRNLMPHAQVLCVDGEMFSWYGSRLRYTAEYMINIRQRLKDSYSL
jgi:ABC-type Fe3+-hydroxamate transport system substrate-binding protein